ncbi:hypothetical protein EJB05_48890, partial [Eragrostis curvula]
MYIFCLYYLVWRSREEHEKTTVDVDGHCIGEGAHKRLDAWASSSVRWRPNDPSIVVPLTAASCSVLPLGVGSRSSPPPTSTPSSCPPRARERPAPGAEIQTEPCTTGISHGLGPEDDPEEQAVTMEASSWDALRKQARRLEAQLDDQMSAYRKLISMKSDGSENDIESDIERSLKQLQQVNSQMQTWVSSGGSEVLSHTLTRHMEILQDLMQEFYRLRSSLRAKQQHASLLDLRDFDRASFDVENSADSSDQYLLKEQAAISRSTGQVRSFSLIFSSNFQLLLENALLGWSGMDNVISQTHATLGALVSQRSTFGGITTKISNVGSRLPTINHILSSIKRKKSMDTIILSLVASVCAFLILIYWLSK